MSEYSVSDREGFRSLTERLEPGDLVRIESFRRVAGNSREFLTSAERLFDAGASLLSEQEGLDTRTAEGAMFPAVCRALTELDRAERGEKRRAGIEKAREAGKYRGRRPIEIDADLFDSVVALWRSGGISAREAMARLSLKPNTFYRRIKEQEESSMKDYKEAEKAIRTELHEAAEQGRRDFNDLRQQVKAGAKEVREQLRSEAKDLKKDAEGMLDLRGAEIELRRDRVRAEAERSDEVRQLKKDVENETRRLKELLGERE